METTIEVGERESPMTVLAADELGLLLLVETSPLWGSFSRSCSKKRQRRRRKKNEGG